MYKIKKYKNRVMQWLYHQWDKAVPEPVLSSAFPEPIYFLIMFFCAGILRWTLMALPWPEDYRLVYKDEIFFEYFEVGGMQIQYTQMLGYAIC